MNKYQKTSFLMESFPELYHGLKQLKPAAIIYAVIIGIMVVLSLFLQWSLIKFFIDCMMGWTLLSIPFIGVIIVMLDKEYSVEKDHYIAKIHHEKMPYKLSMVWGIMLCIAGLVALFYSNTYKKHYAFLCQDFYLEEVAGVYHIFENCEYIGADENDMRIDDTTILKISGKDLLDTCYRPCEACEELAEDAELNY